MASIRPPRQYGIAEHVLHAYSFQTCHSEFQSDGRLPQTGSSDGSVTRSAVGMLSKRVPHGTTRKTLQGQGGLHTIDAAEHPVPQTGQMLLGPSYEETRHKTLGSVTAHFDETGFPLMKNHLGCGLQGQ